jgi:hypothetical protein
MYYATATYTGGNLDAQSWSNWKILGTNAGILGDEPIYSVYPDPCVSYVVDEIIDGDGAGNDYFPEYNIDPFKPNVEIGRTDKSKVTSICIGGNISFTVGPDKLIAFGTSVYNLPNETPYLNNTLFGHVDKYYRVAKWSPRIRQVANNGSIYVGIEESGDSVFYSSDAITWDRVGDREEVTTIPEWLTVGGMAAHRFIIHDGSKFIIYNAGNLVATSTDGQFWTEVNSTNSLAEGTRQVIGTAGHYLAVGVLGVQKSTDGITWAAPVLYTEFGIDGGYSVLWDGSQYFASSTYMFSSGRGSTILTSPDGETWTKVDKVSNPTQAPSLTTTKYDAVKSRSALLNCVKEVSLP